MTLIYATDTPRPLVSDLLNFTASVRRGAPQNYEWTSSDGWTDVSTEPFASHRYSEPGPHSMTVNASNALGYRLARVNFTVWRRTEARLAYSQVPRTAVVGQTFVVSVSVAANAQSRLECRLFLDDEQVANVSDSRAVGHGRGRVALRITDQVGVAVSVRHRVTLLVADLAAGEIQTFFWHIDAFDAVVELAVHPSTLAIATGSSAEFTARSAGGGEAVTFEWDFGDKSGTVNTSGPSSPAHNFTRPGTYTVSVVASNEVSRVSGTAIISVVDVISNVMLLYDGPTTLGDETFIRAVVGTGSQVMYNISAVGATTLARSSDAAVVRYSIAGQYEVSVLAVNAVSNGSASLAIFIVDASTLLVLDVANATCGLPLHAAVTFRADVICANISDVMFRWSIDNVLDSSGRGLSSTAAFFATAGVYQLTLTVWNSFVSVDYRRPLCANESVLVDSYDLPELNVHIGISLIGAPYVPAEHAVVFFPIVSQCFSICTYSWRFWDSTPPTELHGIKVQHAFSQTGVFNVSLTVSRLSVQKTAYTAVEVQTVIEAVVLRAPFEAFDADEPIQFVVATTPDEKDLTYRWSFYELSNCTEFVGNSSAITHAFGSEGLHRAKVTAFNDVSAVSASVEVNVCGKITGLSFFGCCGHVFSTNIEFDALVQTGQVSSYHWTLRRDNATLATSAEKVFVCTLASAGHYEIELAAVNPLSNQTVVDYFTVQVSCMTIFAYALINIHSSKNTIATKQIRKKEISKHTIAILYNLVHRTITTT